MLIQITFNSKDKNLSTFWMAANEWNNFFVGENKPRLWRQKNTRNKNKKIRVNLRSKKITSSGRAREGKWLAEILLAVKKCKPTTPDRGSKNSVLCFRASMRYIKKIDSICTGYTVTNDTHQWMKRTTKYTYNQSTNQTGLYKWQD